MTEQLQAMPTGWRRALAIVAHPDDLEYDTPDGDRRLGRHGLEHS